MGDIYTRLINDFMTSTENAKEDIINPDSVDALIVMLTDFYVFILENGLIAFKDENIKLNNNFTKKIFVAGLNCLREGIPFEQMEFAMEFFLLKAIKDKTVSSQELFEAFLLTKIMPTLWADNDSIKKYLDFIISFCSNKEQHFQLAKFIKIAELYKITDNFTLNQIKSMDSAPQFQADEGTEEIVEWQVNMGTGEVLTTRQHPC